MLEIIIVLSIALVCFLIILGMYICQSRLYTSESNISELQTINSIAQETISATIEQGAEIIESRSINGIGYASGQNTIIVKLASINANKQIIIGAYDYIVLRFDPINSKIISNTEINAGSARIAGEKTIANFVDTLNFRYNSNVWSEVSIVEFTIATKKEINDEDREERAFKTVKLKNK